MTEVPDPLETVTLLKSDFELLQGALDVLTADIGELFELLGIPVLEGVAPREVLWTQAFPRIVMLINSHGKVLQADEHITARMKAAAARFGNKTIESNGVKGLMVGKKDPELARLLSLSTPANRQERREMRRKGLI